MSSFDPHLFFDQKNAPPSAKLLGWKLVDFDTKEGWIKVGFTPKPEFLNPMGVVQGGMICAMIDDTMGPAVVIATKGKYGIQTIDLHTHFLRPVKLEPLTTKATVIQRGKSIVFVECQLFNAAGKLCARAASSAKTTLMPAPETYR